MARKAEPNDFQNLTLLLERSKLGYWYTRSKTQAIDLHSGGVVFQFDRHGKLQSLAPLDRHL